MFDMNYCKLITRLRLRLHRVMLNNSHDT